MKEISILINNESRPIKIVRYFNFGNTKYCIFTFNEIDDQGYKTLYVVKVVNSDNVLIGSGIIENGEWVALVDQIKTIIKDNKEEKTLTIEDLDYNEIEGFPINEGRPFKLKTELTDLLNKGMKEFNKVVKEEQIKREVKEQPIQPEPLVKEPEDVTKYDYLLPRELGVVREPAPQPIDYKALYEEEKTKNAELLIEIGKYKQKLENIKEIID